MKTSLDKICYLTEIIDSLEKIKKDAAQKEFNYKDIDGWITQAVVNIKELRFTEYENFGKEKFENNKEMYINNYKNLKGKKSEKS